MGYTLENIDNRKQYRCGDDFWIGVLEAARAAGWRGEGTFLDFVRGVEESWDEDSSYLWNLFIMINIHMQTLEWDRNYIEKEGQVVSGEDALELLHSLQDSGTDPAFMAFIGEGSFRILP